MSVKFLIDDIALKAPGWGRSRILRKLNDGQNYLMAKPCKQTIYLDPLTGFPPTLTTTSGASYRYSIPNVTMTVGGTSRSLRIWRVNRVFVDDSVSNEYEYTGDPFGFGNYNPYSCSATKVQFREIAVDSGEALENDAAYIQFKDDPGTTTGAYFIEGIIEPLQLTSESLPLTIPKRWEDALFDYVVGKISDQAYGKDSLTARFHDFWAEKIWYEQSKGAQSDSPHTPVFL